MALFLTLSSLLPSETNNFQEGRHSWSISYGVFLTQKVLISAKDPTWLPHFKMSRKDQSYWSILKRRKVE